MQIFSLKKNSHRMIDIMKWAGAGLSFYYITQKPKPMWAWFWAKPPGQTPSPPTRPAKARARGVEPEPDPSPHLQARSGPSNECYRGFWGLGQSAFEWPSSPQLKHPLSKTKISIIIQPVNRRPQFQHPTVWNWMPQPGWPDAFLKKAPKM
jgi:hypothetical protein